MTEADIVWLHAHSAIVHYRDDGRVDVDVVRLRDGLRLQTSAHGWLEAMRSSRALIRERP